MTTEVKFFHQKYSTSEPLLEVDFVLDIRTLSSLIMISQTSCCFVRDEMCLTSCCNPMVAMLALLQSLATSSTCYVLWELLKLEKMDSFVLNSGLSFHLKCNRYSITRFQSTHYALVGTNSGLIEVRWMFIQYT